MENGVGEGREEEEVEEVEESVQLGEAKREREN